MTRGVLLGLFLLSDRVRAAEPERAPGCVTSSRVDLGEASTRAVPEVCVSPDQPTTLVFDSPIAWGTVKVAPEERLADWAQGREGRSIMVLPRADLLVGERVKLTVRFVGDSEPARAEFWLVGHLAQGTRRVEVFRHERPPQGAWRQVAEARAEVRQCQQDKARLLAEREAPGGLMGTAWLERDGDRRWKDLSGDFRQDPGSAFLIMKAKSYRHAESVAVRVHLSSSASAPWRVVGAVLTDGSRSQLELLVWQEEPLAPRGSGVVVVGAQPAPARLHCPCDLELWEEGRTRPVTLRQVTFP
ncbi:DUF2381 family protein [Cystobacter fuscus]|uniref:DUF2381 family protein n=1 Tax=Cystobacter fuscus TaxID=43 RepID=UPI002B290173|nr:DUF2381 family protein [Cystobacter fuscus]